jgi:hypothetical protein
MITLLYRMLHVLWPLHPSEPLRCPAAEQSCFNQPSYENLPLRFGGRIVDKVWVDSLFSSDPRTAHPTFAHIHYETLQRHRRRHVNSSRKRRFNQPIEQLERAKLRRLQPLQEEEDPYIIAILIAMAQEQQCLSSPAPIRDPSSHTQPRVPTLFKVHKDRALPRHGTVAVASHAKDMKIRST